MNKKTRNIIIIVVAVLVVGIVIYFYNKKKKDTTDGSIPEDGSTTITRSRLTDLDGAISGSTSYTGGNTDTDTSNAVITDEEKARISAIDKEVKEIEMQISMTLDPIKKTRLRAKQDLLLTEKETILAKY
jgi:hypothetical protein